MNKRRTKVDAIPKGQQYTGYLWCTDAQTPQIFLHDVTEFSEALLTKHPFVIEGWLYDADRRCSYAIRWVDGAYVRTRYDLSDISEEHERVYLAHDLKFIEKFRVVEHWETHPDPLCEGLEVLRPAWTAFAGFVESKKS